MAFAHDGGPYASHGTGRIVRPAASAWPNEWNIVVLGAELSFAGAVSGGMARCRSTRRKESDPRRFAHAPCDGALPWPQLGSRPSSQPSTTNGSQVEQDTFQPGE